MMKYHTEERRTHVDWIRSIQKAIDYIEDHLLETIDYESIAHCACSSSFHFQRIFHILCGFTLGDYIRMRRLTLAGQELSSTNLRVIDIALKYGYVTPESFSRAFTKFHGVTPSAVKQGGVVLNSFSPLFVKLTLEGGSMIQYRLETRDAFPIICKKMKASSQDEAPGLQISRFWKACIEDGTINALCSYIHKDNIFDDSIVGVSFGNDGDDQHYPYAIAAHYNGDPIKETELEVVMIPAHTYVVFPVVGKMPEAFVELYQKISGEFFLTSDVQVCGGVEFEAYPSANITNEAYRWELWLSVTKK